MFVAAAPSVLAATMIRNNRRLMLAARSAGIKARSCASTIRTAELQIQTATDMIRVILKAR